MTAAVALLPADHVRILHPAGRRGIATVAQKGGQWVERAVALADLAAYAAAMRGASDVYLSQQSFYGFRRIVQLAQLGALYSDIDYRNAGAWRGETPERVAFAVLEALKQAGIPPPAYILSTGQGLLATWLHDFVPRAALPRWMAVQRQILAVLKPFGADPMAIDAARVFRLSGTRHSGADAIVRQVWPVRTSATPFRWAFDDLATEILPIARAEIVALRVERAKRTAQGNGPRPARMLTAATYWETVLADLQRLRTHRWFGDLPPGQRDAWLMLASVAVAWLAPAPVVRREIVTLAHEAGGWSEGEATSRMSAVLARAERAARGGKMEWRGRMVDPRYRFRAATMVEWLGIEPAEMRAAGLRVLVDETIAREHATDRELQRQRRAGVMPRSEYEAKAAVRRGTARAMRDRGMTFRAIATEMQVSATEVHRLLSTDVPGG